MDLANLFKKKGSPSFDDYVNQSIKTGQPASGRYLPDAVKEGMISRIYDYGMTLDAVSAIPPHPRFGDKPVQAAVKGYAKSIVYAAEATISVYIKTGAVAGMALVGPEQEPGLCFFGHIEDANGQSRPKMVASLNHLLRSLLETDGDPSEMFIDVLKDMAKYIEDGADFEYDVYPAMCAAMYAMRLSIAITIPPMLGLPFDKEHEASQLVPAMVNVLRA